MDRPLEICTDDEMDELDHHARDVRSKVELQALVELTDWLEVDDDDE